MIAFAKFIDLRETRRVRTVLTRSIETAAEFIKSGGIVAFPTETVYGLGAGVFDEAAIAKIFEAKRRPADNPLIAHIGDLGQIADLASEVPAFAEVLMEEFFPGALTLVVKKSPRVPLIATAGLESVGVRMPASALANEFLIACKTSVVAPSANLSGRPSPTTWEAVFEDLDGRIDCILQGEPTDIGLESTVVDCTGSVPIILRSGAVSLEALKRVISSISIHQPSADAPAKSPGMLHKHYAPSARVVIVEGEIEAEDSSAYIGLHLPNFDLRIKKICNSVEEYAKSIFAFFRECDNAGIQTIYCERVNEEGIGAALMDRIRRAEAR